MTDIPTLKLQAHIDGGWVTIAELDGTETPYSSPFGAVPGNAAVPVRVVEEYSNE